MVALHPMPGDDAMQRKPDMSLARKSRDWDPSIPFDAGFDKTIEYFRNSACAG